MKKHAQIKELTDKKTLPSARPGLIVRPSLAVTQWQLSAALRYQLLQYCVFIPAVSTARVHLPLELNEQKEPIVSRDRCFISAKQALIQTHLAERQQDRKQYVADVEKAAYSHNEDSEGFGFVALEMWSELINRVAGNGEKLLPCELALLDIMTRHCDRVWAQEFGMSGSADGTPRNEDEAAPLSFSLAL
jgi:hypothetical protein